jgi:hypothetical protein
MVADGGEIMVSIAIRERGVVSTRIVYVKA